MPRGRPRRSGSSSSVETVDLSKVRWRQETSVIKAAPKDENQNDHIVFEVKDMTVFGGSAGSYDDGEPPTYPSVLEAPVKGPFSARGTLIFDDERADERAIQLARTSLNTPQETPIEIPEVRQFSIGETEDRQPCIWALGRRQAWFEIKPSAGYKATYDAMAEAVFLYYRIVDFYGCPDERTPMPGKRDEITRLFHQYASAVGDGSTYEDVQERCARHALFLCYQFEVEKEYTVPPDDPEGQRTSWHTTEIYKWLKKHGNGALFAVQQALKNPPSLGRMGPVRRQDTQPKASPSVAPSFDDPSSEDSTSDSADSDIGRKKTKPAIGAPGRYGSFKKAASQNSVERDSPASLDSAPIVATDPQNMCEEDHAALQKLVQAIQVVAQHRKGGLTRTSVTQLMYSKYRFPDMSSTGYYKQGVEEVLHYYAKALLRDAAFQAFRGTEMYDWVRELSNAPFKYANLKADRFPFVCEPRGQRTKRDDGSGRDESAVSAQEDFPHAMRTPVAGKRLPGRPSKSALSIATPSRKRPFDEITAHSDEDSENKRSMYFEDGDDAMDEDSAQDNSALDGERTSVLVPYGEPVDFVLRAEPLTSWVSKRLDGAWVCDRNECDFVVRGDGEAEARERILKHIDEHAPLACGRESCEFTVDDEDKALAQLRMGDHVKAQHGPYKCERDGCDFIARQERGIEEERRVKEHIAEHERQDQKLVLAKSESRPHLPIEYGSPIISSRPKSPSPSSTNSPLDTAKLRRAPGIRSKFRQLLQHFTRTPRPVSDKLANMDVLQTLAREDQGAKPTERRRSKRARR